MTFVAWIAAYRTTLFIHDDILQQITNRYLGDRHPFKYGPPDLNYFTGICGMVGGLIGSAIVVLGVAVAAPDFRASNNWALTIVLGTLCGFLLECALNPFDDALPLHVNSLLPLYFVWQVSVAASIAYHLTPRISPSPRAA